MNPLIINPVKSKQTFSTPERQSMGIADDFAVRKDVATLSGTIEKTPVNDNDIANKAYVDSVAGSGGAILKVETHFGNEFTGTDGETNRTIELTGTVHGVPIIVYDTTIVRIADFTLVGQTLTILINLFDSVEIDVYFI